MAVRRKDNRNGSIPVAYEHYRTLLIGRQQAGFYRFPIALLLRQVSFFVLEYRIRQSALNLSSQQALALKALGLGISQRQYPDESIQWIEGVPAEPGFTHCKRSKSLRHRVLASSLSIGLSTSRADR